MIKLNEIMVIELIACCLGNHQCSSNVILHSKMFLPGLTKFTGSFEEEDSLISKTLSFWD